MADNQVFLLLVVLSNLLVAGVMLGISSGGANETVGRNAWVGIRTKATMASDAGWAAAHQATKPVIRVCALCIAGASVLTLAWIGSAALTGLWVALGVLIVGITVLVCVVVPIANRAARQATEAQHQAESH